MRRFLSRAPHVPHNLHALVLHPYIALLLLLQILQSFLDHFPVTVPERRISGAQINGILGAIPGSSYKFSFFDRGEV